MYAINTPAVYAHESVMSNATYRARVESVVAALQEPREIITYSDDQLPDMIKNRGLAKGRVCMGTLNPVPDPILLFNTFRFDSKEEAQKRKQALVDAGLKPEQCNESLLGTGAFHWACYNLKEDPCRNDKVCRPCWRIHLEQGCLHKCKYCGLGGLLVSMVNIEDYCKYLGQIIERHPWQKTYLLDDDADPPGLEPEFGCLGKLIEYFGTLKDRYLIIHTKTWNTEWMRDLKHNGNTIIVWSVSGPTQSRQIEPNTGTTEQRIEAARIAQEAGYQIRYKFKPIIPVKSWREDAAKTAEMIFTKTNPDVISLCCFMWMDVDEMKRRLAQVADMLDPAYLKAAEESKAEVEDTRAKPFPDWVRAEIYEHHLSEIRKHSKDIPVSLSTENWKMWSKFSKKLGMTATNYVCGCGPQTTPGAKKLDCHPFKVAVRNDDGIPGVSG
ncbi:MAG: spore photoproduct lyase family protein [Planctomycetota bacterium]